MKKKLIGTRGVLLATSMGIMIISVIITAIIGVSGIRKTNNLGIKNYNESMNDGYDAKIKSQVQSAITVLSYYYQLSKNSKLSEKDAQTKAKEIIRNMRYGDDFDNDGISDGYFWIDDTDYNLVMHPILTDQEGSNRKDLKDNNNVYIIQDILKSAQNGGGYNRFLFTKSDGKTIAPKVAYSELFKPWNWVITTGNYIDDMESQMKDTSRNLDKIIHDIIVQLTVTIIIMMILAFVISFTSTKFILSPIIELKNDLLNLSNGDLSFHVNKKTLCCRDEIGVLGISLDTVRKTLCSIVNDIKKASHEITETGKIVAQSATHSRDNSNEIAQAVENISEGAVSQAEEVQNAAQAIEIMSEKMEQMNDKIQMMSTLSTEMYDAGTNAGTIISELESRNDNTMNAIHNVATQIEKTNTSVQKIKESTQLITEIATQTDLLSLNASIEAARAGEFGKGFAVVAEQIKKLAEESQFSAVTIEEIIDTLIAESDEMVKTMDALSVQTKDQKIKLDETKTRFGEVSDKIQTTQNHINVLRSSADICNEEKNKVTDVIESLSSISEENAAATEETNASMQELNHTIDGLTEHALQLDIISTKLLNTMGFFN